jgi:citrate lyase beta subunit
MKFPVQLRRSLLFVPAVRPDRYPKALKTGADAVCVDLEDGVGLSSKEVARKAALGLFADRTLIRTEVSLRINAGSTDLGRRDLDTLVNFLGRDDYVGSRPDALVLPKVSDPDEVRAIELILCSLTQDHFPLIIQIETARGVEAAMEIGAASANVSALLFGAIDLAAEIGCAVEWDALLYSRSKVVLAAAAAGISAIDAPYMDVAALEALGDESRRSRRLGFVGKVAIHPRQVPVIQDSFSPTDEEVAWARKVVAAYESQEGGVLLLDGKLIERPVVLAAQRTLQAGQVDGED